MKELEWLVMQLELVKAWWWVQQALQLELVTAFEMERLMEQEL